MAVPAPVILNSVITKRVIPSPLSSPLGLRPNPDQYALRSSFFSPSIHLLTLPPLIPASSGRFSMRVTSKKAYICRDCGYVYNDRTPFEKLPDKYSCPVCAAPKRRFRPYEPKVTKNANAKDVRQSRKSQLKRDEAIGNALPIGIVVGVVLLAALYFYLNNAF
ncbi:Rubredoxin [Zostera marina]|uniref:Rubredoxin n=1 Tax=Zostera marina TaxID=29655 RepID=A0A0K9Q129_ZOSMR|nr:Rubredoxin [Zostera marina]